MIINKISVKNLRVHDSFSRSIKDRVSVITGKNGSGKTSILEALNIALSGTSFRGSDRELIKEGQDWWRIDIETDEGLRKIILDGRKEPFRKKFIIDEKQTARLPKNKKYPVILFEPDDLGLIHGSPSRRRKFIDNFIKQVYFDYQSVLNKYERALKQRNALLKEEYLSSEDVFVWDVALSKYGSEIGEKRYEMINQINQKIDKNYQSISGTNDNIDIEYSENIENTLEQKILNSLRNNFEKDKILGYTSTGPHRQDIMFYFNNQPAIKVASRGEIRSIVLALKFIEVDITKEATGISPVVLLDDVFAELDETRQKRLAEKIQNNQIFITSTNSYTGIKTNSVIALD